MTEVDVAIADDESWSLETKQHMLITEVKSHGSRKAGIGDLPKSTIVILNDDAFPMGCDPEEKNADGDFKYSEGDVIRTFATHIWGELSVPGTMGIIYKMYPAIHWVMTQLLMLLAINIAFKEHVNDTKMFRTVMFSLGGAYVVSLGLWMLASWEYIELRLGGKSRMLLKKAIAGTMLQLTESEQEEFPTGEIIGITTDVVNSCVGCGWTGLFAMWEFLFTLIVLTAYTAYAVRKTPYLLLIPLVQLIVDYAVYVWRSPEMVAKAMVAIEKEDDWKSKLLEIAYARQVVTSFKASPIIVPLISKEIGGANKSLWQSDRYASDTQKILKVFHSLFIVLCFLGGGELWRDDPTSFKTGNFVALMATIFKFDSTVGRLFAKMNDMNVGYAYVRRLATLLNADTRRKEKLRWTEAQDNPDPECPDDITVHDVSFTFEKTEAKTTVGPFNFSIEQGQVVCINSDGVGLGRKTLLKLMAGLYLPSTGYVSFPGPLRVRYIPAVPLIFKGTLMYNLRFGLLNKATKDEDGKPLFPYTEQQIWDTWALVGGSSMYNKEHGAEANATNMALTDQTCCSVARALISDCDVLLAGGSFDALGVAKTTRLIIILRDWIKNRGISCLSNISGNVQNRKKKTLIFVTKNEFTVEEANAVITLQKQE